MGNADFYQSAAMPEWVASSIHRLLTSLKKTLKCPGLHSARRL